MPGTELLVETVGPSTEAGARAGLTVQLPKLRDPRLHVASVLLTVQVLGQVTLGFELSIAQILVALGTAGLIEVLLTVRRTRVIAWPASALLTGNGVALILRVPGTEHGDWFSMRGWYVFSATAAIAVLSKYVIRRHDQPVFNPSNLGLVVTFLILGSGLADPQDLWWGPMSAGLVITYLVIVVGGVVITRRLRLLAVSVAFWSVFASLMAVLAVTGHTMAARWNLGPVEGMHYWTTLALSPEILIFVFFMITDPRTVARGRTAAILFGVCVGAVSGILVAFQSTEYATKVALLSGLVVVCGARVLIERIAPATEDEGPRRWVRAGPRRPAALASLGAAVVVMVLVGSWSASRAVPVEAASTARRPQVELAPEQRPEVSVGGEVTGVGTTLDDATAARIAREVVENVLLADRAVERGDRGLAAAVAIGPFLDELSRRRAEPAPERTFSSAVIDVVRDPENFQSVPRLAVTLTGTADGAPWSATFHVSTQPGSLLVREVAAS